MKILFTILLVFSAFFSAIQVVLAQHESRKIFVEIQELEKERDHLNEEWGKLQLEQSTWGTDDRIEDLARSKLDMKNPEMNSVVIIAR